MTSQAQRPPSTPQTEAFDAEVVDRRKEELQSNAESVKQSAARVIADVQRATDPDRALLEEFMGDFDRDVQNVTRGAVRLLTDDETRKSVGDQILTGLINFAYRE